MSDVKKQVAFVDTEEYRKRCAPKIVSNPQDLSVFVCPRCRGVVFDHSGFLETLNLPDQIEYDDAPMHWSHELLVCRGCRAHYAWVDGQMYEITKIVDVTAWKEAERKENDQR